mgnify:CR=1 FL=1|jgi:N utilization substance protein B|tara:strand:+ start:485 stop:859 length:375 start_codon:yes stop_codon:yes gene_type:complete
MIVLQVLCESDTVSHNAGDVLSRVLTEEKISLEGSKFARELVHNVLENISGLDSIIETYATTWPVSQMLVVDRNLLRMAIAEMESGLGVPQGAIVNEVVEIAKIFGSESSPGFVNGVLGSLLDR